MFTNVRRISRQLLAYGTADVLVLAINFLLLPLYTRVLSPGEYGALALLLVCEAVLKIVNRWGLDAAYLRLHYECTDENERKLLAGSITVFLAAANGVLLVLLMLSSAPIARVVFGTADFLLPFRLLVVNSYASAFLFLPMTLLRIEERSRLFASMTVLRAFGTTILRLVLVIGAGLGVTGIVLADSIVTAVLLIALAPTLRRMAKWAFSQPALTNALRFGAPQVPFGLLSQASSLSDRFILGMFMPLAQVGLYLIGATIAGLIKFYPVAFEAAWMPFAYDSLKRPDAPRLFARLGTYAFAVLAFVTVAVAGVAEPVVQLALPVSYHAATSVIPVLACAMAVQSLSWFLVTSLNVAKQTHIFPVVTAAGAAASIAFNIALIPSMGMIGAAIALLASQTVITSLTAVFAQRAFHIPYQRARLAKVAIVAAATYTLMNVTPAGTPWQSLGIRAALLAVFPLALTGVKFFEPHEIAELRRAVQTRTLSPLPR